MTSWLAGSGGLMLLAAVGIWAGPAFASRESTPNASGRRPLPVATLTARSASGYTVEREYAGEIVARRASEIGFEQAGRVVELLVDEGDEVAAGAVLARLDTRNITARRDQQRAQLATARAQLDELERGPRVEVIAQARAEVRRTDAEHRNWQSKLAKREDLFGKGLASEEERDDARYATQAAAAALEAAGQRLAELENGTRPERIAAQQATVAQLEAAVRDTEIMLEKAMLLAPFDGRIARRPIDEGQVVAPGTTILRIVEDRVLEARIGVPGAMASSFQAGDRHALTIGPLACEGVVRAVLPEVDPSTRTVTIVFQLQASATAARPRPGQIARLTWPTPVDTDGFWLPLPALTKAARGLWSCYVIHDAGDTPAVERRAVEVLHVDNDRAYVRGVLLDGERVVRGGVERIVPGQRVEVSD